MWKLSVGIALGEAKSYTGEQIIPTEDAITKEMCEWDIQKPMPIDSLLYLYLQTISAVYFCERNLAYRDGNVAETAVESDLVPSVVKVMKRSWMTQGRRVADPSRHEM
jgi:hypothetical protein